MIINVLPETGWRAAKETRSATEGTKSLIPSKVICFSAQTRAFVIWVCNDASLGVCYKYNSLEE